MNRTLLAMSAIGALAAGTPVAAQYIDTAFDARIEQLDDRIDAGVRAGTITRREALMLRPQLRQIARLEARYSLNGFTRAERLDLQARIRALRQDVRVADAGRWDRYERYGYWDDQYTGRGGPLDEIDLKIGMRAPSGLLAVPFGYRSRYRDGGGVYFRSDGRAIYGIDARTNTVVQVHLMPQ